MSRRATAVVLNMPSSSPGRHAFETTLQSRGNDGCDDAGDDMGTGPAEAPREVPKEVPDGVYRIYPIGTSSPLTMRLIRNTLPI